MEGLDGKRDHSTRFHTLLYFSCFHLTATMYIHPITTEQTMALRHAVLWPEKDISYVCLPEDAQGFHFGAFLPEFDQPACILSLFVERPPAADGAMIYEGHENNAVRFRKFACDPAYRGRTYNLVS